MNPLVIAFLFLFTSIGLCQHELSSEYPNGREIDQYVEHLMKRQGIPGVSLAIIKNDEVLYKKHFGHANIEHQVPVTDKSIFRVYSLTKPIVTVGIFKLIEEGRLHLKDPVSKYLFDLPDSWNKIRIEHLLSHSSGLPDMAPIPDFQDLSEEEARARVFNQDIRFQPGEQYEYNQTGFYLLQKIIEKITGEGMSTFIIESQFEASKNAFFSSDSRDIVQNRATPYFPFATGSLTIEHPYLQGSYGHAKNGLNITLDEFITWDIMLRKNELINKKSKGNMWKTYKYKKSNQPFTYGWEKRKVNEHQSFGFSGSMCTAYRVFPGEELSIIFLTNGFTSWYNINNIINHLVYLVDENIIDLNNLAFESILKASVEKNKDEFVTAYKKIKTNSLLAKNNFETHLNDVGYFWLRSLRKPDRAIEVFELGTKEYPSSSNAHDSLAEAFEVNGDNENAILNYNKAIELNNNKEYINQTNRKIEKLKK